MYLSTIFTSFFALMVYAIPLARHRQPTDLACANPGDCYKITTMDITSGESVQLRFTLYDDAKSTNNTTVCSASWEVGANTWPQKYIKCNDDMFQWMFSKFDTVTDWNMEAAHDFKLGDSGARAFANGTATIDDFACQSGTAGVQYCSLKGDHVINLNKYAMIA
ncbi:alpha-amlyase [Diplodia corticola]|uniref:Alpha-amlyase n=1 Tax=Diplodia corticola TaxID=236234 RepID=A0A1J9RQB7_9PEZI|nr:alpha-amlyase [Diplodia corticola]OJD30092.1 alpha-amlyase [Diplodia corticola]